jgi:DHA2 family methylenomycin A resistance protein-like MFS transporter
MKEKRMITPTPSHHTKTLTMVPLLAICLGYFMTILDVTIVNAALVDIKDHLSANVTGLQWIVDGYALVFASFLLTGGTLGDKRGRKTVFLSRGSYPLHTGISTV